MERQALCPFAGAAAGWPTSTPIERAGCEPMWREDCPGGKLECMKFSVAHGSLDAYDTYAIPGAFHFGQKSAMGMTEQQINYFRPADQPVAATVEWTVGICHEADGTTMGDGERRIFFRPRRFKNGGHIYLASPGGVCYLLGQRSDAHGPRKHIPLKLTAHKGDWIHCVFSHKIDPETNHLSAVFAANGEIVEWEGPSLDPIQKTGGEGWCLEWNSGLGPDDGWYVRQVRGYREFFDAATMKKIFHTGLDEHLRSQPPIAELDVWPGARKPLAASNPKYLNRVEPPAHGVPEDAVTLDCKDLVFRLQTHGEGDPIDAKDLWVSRDKNAFHRNVLVQFPPMLVRKQACESPGRRSRRPSHYRPLTGGFRNRGEGQRRGNMDSVRELLQEAAVVLLCAGQGTRMRSGDRNKVCFSIDGVPAILRALRMFDQLGVERIVLVVGASAEDVLRTVAKEFPDVAYVFQREQRGTGHAAQAAAAVLGSLKFTGPLLVTMGDKVIEPQVILELTEQSLRSGADLAFVSGPKIQDGIPSSAGRIVTDRSGAILGDVEVRDIQRARILESLAKIAARRREARITYDQIVKAGSRHIPDEKKLATALWPMLETIQEAGGMTGRRILTLLGPQPGRIRLAGKTMSPDQIERHSKTVNLSVYLGTGEFWGHFLPRLRDENAQREFYLTDVINLAVEEGREDGSRWKLAQHVIDDPTAAMAFNSPEELLRIEDILRRKRLAVRPLAPGEAVSEGARPPENTLRPAGKWLDLFERWPAALQREFGEIYGPGGGKDRREIFVRALRLFVERFGPDRKAIIVRAPGRVNLMGRHVDHRGGAVNVMAIDRDVVFVAAAREDDVVTLCNVKPKDFTDREFSVRETFGAIDWEDWLTYVNSSHVRALLASSKGDWSNYVKAPLLRLQQRFRDIRIRGFDAAVAGDIPMAAGLSSSSALVVASAETAVAFNGLDVHPAELVDLCGEGEWFVGSRGGAADHAAIRLCRRGQLSHVEFLPFRMGEVYDFPENCRVIIAHSGFDARKSASAKDQFNQKVASYEMGFMLLKDRLPQYGPLLEHLRDLNPQRLNCPASQIYRALLQAPESMETADLREALWPKHRERLEAIFSSHHPPERYDLRGVLLYGVAECARSRLAPDLLKRGDVEEFGRLMRISHDGDRKTAFRKSVNGKWRSAKYRYDCSDEAMSGRCEQLSSEEPWRVQEAQLCRQPGAYGCSLPQIDKMIDVVSVIPGVHGAQLGGAGLGGCIMILLGPEAVDPVRDALTREYYEPSEIQPLIHVCHPVAGSEPLAV